MQSFKAIILAALLTLATTPARALVLPEIVEMTPHRAVYDITLGDAKSSAGISSGCAAIVASTFRRHGRPAENFGPRDSHI